MINDITLWILEIFFGLFTIVNAIQFYMTENKMSTGQGVFWFISAIIFAFTSGQLFG